MTSLVYHASVTFVLQVFDFFGMYFFFSLVLLLNLGAVILRNRLRKKFRTGVFG